jgi:hypothetical protein
MTLPTEDDLDPEWNGVIAVRSSRTFLVRERCDDDDVAFLLISPAPRHSRPNEPTADAAFGLSEIKHARGSPEPWAAFTPQPLGAAASRPKRRGADGEER